MFTLYVLNAIFIILCLDIKYIINIFNKLEIVKNTYL